MTDTTKYSNISVSKKTYSDLQRLSKEILPGDTNLSISKTVTHLVNCKIKEFNEFFNSNYKSPNFDTISGLLINKFKGLPKTHDIITIDKYRFQIKISDQRRIHSIQVEVKD